MVITYSKGKDQPGKVANPACLWSAEKGNYFFLSPFAPENLVSRDGFGSPVPRQSRVSLLIFTLRLNLVLTYGIPPEFRGGVDLFI